jgi:hypothetical protein
VAALPWLALAAPESAAASLLGARMLDKRGAEEAAGPPPRSPGGDASGESPGRGPALAVLAVVVAVALLEAVTALRPRAVPQDQLAAASAVVRAQFQPGDLITSSPPWLTQLVQRELGDLMPAAMLGRPDARRYGRIWTLQFGSAGSAALAEDIGGLPMRLQQPFGAVTLSRYEQQPVEVRYDLTEQLLAAQVTQAAIGSAAPEVPCLWSGPTPTFPPPRGPAGAFRCPGGTVERRSMEIDYRPRYGVVVTLAEGQRTSIEYSGIPDTAWQGARLSLWLGLHDYHARKTAVGPAEVVVDLDHGTRRLPISVAVDQGFRLSELALPAGTTGSLHSVRIELSAPSAHNHFVGLHGELRR